MYISRRVLALVFSASACLSGFGVDPTGIFVNGVSVGDHAGSLEGSSWRYDRDTKVLTLQQADGEYTLTGFQTQAGTISQIVIERTCKVTIEALVISAASEQPMIYAPASAKPEINVYGPYDTSLGCLGPVCIDARGAKLTASDGGRLMLNPRSSTDPCGTGIIVNDFTLGDKTSVTRVGFIHAENQFQTVKTAGMLNAEGFLGDQVTFTSLGNSASLASINARSIVINGGDIYAEQGISGDDIQIKGGTVFAWLRSSQNEMRFASAKDEVRKYYGAAIGPGVRRTSSTASIRISGGIVTATNNHHCAIGNSMMWGGTYIGQHHSFGSCKQLSVSIGDAEVYATGGLGRPGIGIAYDDEASFSLTINGPRAKVYADGTGDSRSDYPDGPGIGVSSCQGTGKVVIQYGERIVASGGKGAPGIGRGSASDGPVSLSVYGGRLQAYGGNESPAIEVSGAVNISGGLVYAKGDMGNATDICDIGSRHGERPTEFTVTGGSVVLAHNNSQGIDGSGRYCHRVLILGLPYIITNHDRQVNVSGLDGYGTKQLLLWAYDDDGNGELVFLLPNGEYEFTIDGGRYTANVNGGDVVAVPHFYTITFEVEDSRRRYTADPLICNPSRVYQLPATIPETEGHWKLLGWCDKSRQKRYSPGMLVFNAAQAGENINLTPVWQNLRRYMVVHLGDGRKKYYSDVPAGGWPEEYFRDYIVMRYIDPGTFTMGDIVHNRDVKPQVEVTITSPYYIGVYEVTQNQWLWGTSQWVGDDDHPWYNDYIHPAYYADPSMESPGTARSKGSPTA